MIGFIFECGPQGADKHVCEYLASQLRPGVKPISRTMDNKPNLLEGAASVAKRLLEEGCERVLIVWDLRPAWPDKKEKPCRATERQTLLDALAQAGGPGEDAQPKQIGLYRAGAQKVEVIPFDALIDPARAVNYAMEDGDVLLLPRSGLGEFGYFMRQISPGLSVLTIGASLNTLTK